MYGDTDVIRQRARELQGAASEIRTQAKSLAEAGAVEWKSTAAAAFIQDLADRAVELRKAADLMDEAAVKLDAHAVAVDAVKAAIESAARWVTDRRDEAVHLVGNTVEAVLDGAGRVFEFFGKVVPDYLVERAQDVVAVTSSMPTPGSRDWLDLAEKFRLRGL